MAIEVFRSELQVLFTLLITTLTGDLDVSGYVIRQNYDYDQFIIADATGDLYQVSTYTVLDALNRKRPIPTSEVRRLPAIPATPAPVEPISDGDALDPFELRTW